MARFEAKLRAAVEADATRTTELGGDSPPSRRRGGRAPVRRRRGRRAAVRDRRRARPDRGRARGGRPPPRGRRRRARRGRGSRRARDPPRAARAPPRAARPGQPAREGGVRRREGAARRAHRPARGSRAEPRRAREAPPRAHRDGRDALRGDLRRGREALRRGRREPLPGRRGPPAPHRARSGGRGARHRGRATPGRQARHAALAPLGRREGARRARVPLQPVPLPPEPVLPPRRGRGSPRRHEHRPLHRAPAPVRRPRPVHRRHPPEAHDGGRRRPLRRHDGHRGRLADRLAPPAARSPGRRYGVAIRAEQRARRDDAGPAQPPCRSGAITSRWPRQTQRAISGSGDTSAPPGWSGMLRGAAVARRRSACAGETPRQGPSEQRLASRLQLLIRSTPGSVSSKSSGSPLRRWKPTIRVCQRGRPPLPTSRTLRDPRRTTSDGSPSTVNEGQNAGAAGRRGERDERFQPTRASRTYVCLLVHRRILVQTRFRRLRGTAGQLIARHPRKPLRSCLEGTHQHAAERIRSLRLIDHLGHSFLRGSGARPRDLARRVRSAACLTSGSPSKCWHSSAGTAALGMAAYGMRCEHRANRLARYRPDGGRVAMGHRGCCTQWSQTPTCAFARLPVDVETRPGSSSTGRAADCPSEDAGSNPASRVQDMQRPAVKRAFV